MRFAIWRNTTVVVAAYVLAILALDRLVLSRVLASPPLALALSFATVQTAAILLMLFALFFWKRRNVLRNARTDRLAAAIEEALALHAIGEDRTDALRRLVEQSRYDVREKLLAVAATMRGEARERISALGRDLGLLRQSGVLELEAMRHLVRVSHAHNFEAVIAWASRQPLLVRALIADELLVYAGEIEDEQIVQALSSPDRLVVSTTLEMLRAWRRTVRVPGFSMLLANANPRVREGAFDALAYLGAQQEPDALAAAIEAGLRHDDAGVRAAAARAAGRHRAVTTTGALAEHVGDPDRRVAIAAAHALASLGAPGLAVLERLLTNVDRQAATAAFEAWEKAAIGRLEPA